MADLKISQLPEVVSPITGDILPIVNSSETKKVTIANLNNSLPIDTFTRSASANWQSTFTTIQSISGKIGTHIPLSFSNLNNFDIPGDGQVRNLGDLVGMTVIFHPNTDFMRGVVIAEDATNWYFDIQLNLPAQYGGTAIDTGINLDYSSNNGSLNTDIFAASQRFQENGANYEVHYRRFSFFVPKVYLGAATNYIRLNVIARRPSTNPGNTGIISGGSIKFLTT
jgi:hypothetical protein